MYTWAMASARTRLVGRQGVEPVIIGKAKVTPATPTRAQSVGGPLLAPSVVLANMSAEEIITEAGKYTQATTSARYALGTCLLELARPERYQDELGFDTFEELLRARALPKRVTAHKLIRVLTTYSEREVKQLGGFEKSYALVRFTKRKDAKAEPRQLLLPTARVFGKLLRELSVREVNDAANGYYGPAKAKLTKAKEVGSRLESALRRAGLEPDTRVHEHAGACVSMHLTEAHAAALSEMLVRLKEKQAA